MLACGGTSKKNVLFLVADDLRPELSCYLETGTPSIIYPKIQTPHIDNLATKSLLVKRAFVQQAICAPSRTSFLTGRRPDTTHVWDLYTYFRESGGDFTTVPQYFKQNGYKSIGIGKIFHPGKASGSSDDPPSWSEKFIRPSNGKYYQNKTYSWMPITEDQWQNKPLPDQQIAQSAVQTLQQVADGALKGQQPFFLAVGFQKPHLPFIFPDKFLERYPLQDISLPTNPYAPRFYPSIAWSKWGELRIYQDILSLSPTGNINTTLPDSVTIGLRQAYYSTVSYIDHLVGQVLAELDNLGLAEDTIVSFIGDHGFQLGEHGSWCKQTNFETSTHAPMMIRVPGVTDNGIVTNKLVEFVDLFPTLTEAAGLGSLDLCPENSSLISVCTEGHSLLPLMRDPDSASWKTRVFSQYPRNHMKVMGYSMRTESHRYTEWVGFKGAPDFKPIWDDFRGAELYELEVDPLENINKAGYKRLKGLRRKLSQQLRDGWRAAQPQM